MVFVVSSDSPWDLLRVAGFSAAFIWCPDWSWLSCIAIGSGLAALEAAHGGSFLLVGAGGVLQCG